MSPVFKTNFRSSVDDAEVPGFSGISFFSVIHIFRLFTLISTFFFCISCALHASAANSSAVEASPSNVDALRIPKIALTPSKSLPALVEVTALSFLCAIVTSTFASCSVQSPSFWTVSRVFSIFPVFCQIRETAIRQPSFAETSPPTCTKGSILPILVNP